MKITPVRHLSGKAHLVGDAQAWSMPVFGQLRSSCRALPDHLGGRAAEVGSSNSMIRGRMQGCGRSPTRLVLAAGQWPGYSGPVPDLAFSRNASPSHSASSWRRCAPRSAPGVQFFRRIVRCGNRLKCWNTIPTSERILSMFLRSSDNSVRRRRCCPFWCFLSLVDAAGSASTCRTPSGPQHDDPLAAG